MTKPMAPGLNADLVVSADVAEAASSVLTWGRGQFESSAVSLPPGKVGLRRLSAVLVKDRSRFWKDWLRGNYS